MNAERYRKIIYWILPILDVLFCLWYVKNTTCDMVHFGYVRLVNSYPPDVYDPNKFFVPDVLTRVLIDYLYRIVNVEPFGFSITFERVPGVVGLGLTGWAFGIYCRGKRIGCGWFALLMAVVFGLNKQEVLTNGSEWSHFFAFACFYYHELVLDRVWSGGEKKHDRVKLLALPWLIMLGTTGPYRVVYVVTLLVSYGFRMMRDGLGREERTGKEVLGVRSWDMRYLAYMACTLIPLLLYTLSNSSTMEEYVGATERPLMKILSDNPIFPVRFMLESFAGTLAGGEELQELMRQGVLSSRMCYLIGMFVLLGYVYALYLNLRFELYGRTILPMMLLVGGGLNHVIIFISRYIFENGTYTLSSRYALQFQVGILGLVLTFAPTQNEGGEKRRAWQWLTAVFCLAILAGNSYTTYHEIRKAPNREASFEKKAVMAPLTPGMSREGLEAAKKDLEDTYECRKGVDKIQEAFRILEENRLNIFR